MGSPREAAPAAPCQPVVGIGVGVWAADFDGPSRTRVMQLFLPSFGASRRLVRVCCWCCARLSQRSCAAADPPQEATIPASNEEEGPAEPAYQTTRPRLPL